MAKFYKTDTQEILTFQEAKALFPRTGIPNDPKSSVVIDFFSANGILPVAETEKPSAPWNKKLVEGVEVINGSPTQTWTMVDKTQGELNDWTNSLIETLDNRRWEVEQGGIVINGMTILTRDRDKVLINGKITEAMVKGLSDNDEFKFTLGGSDITMTIGQLKSIGVAISEHVQRTVDVASEVRVLINSFSITEHEDVIAEFDAGMEIE